MEPRAKLTDRPVYGRDVIRLPAIARAACTTLVGLALLATACSSDVGNSSVGDEPIFGTEDTACASVSTRNEDGDEALIEQVSDCLLDEIAAGQPVTVDIAALSAEGDPIYYRYAYDGDRVLIVEDNRADEFGRPTVVAKICAGVEATRWIPEGVDCSDTDHPGFPEAAR